MKPIHWVGGSLDDLREFPPPVQDDIGYALYLAQMGDKSRSAKPLVGFDGAGVLEIVENHDGSTYRAVYTVRFETSLYVLHVFQKKSKRGIKTPKPTSNSSDTAYRPPATMLKRRRMTEVLKGTTNVFADLGLPDADTHLVKAGIARRIDIEIEKRAMSEAAAAEAIGVSIESLDDIRRGRFRAISLETLMQCLVALGHSVTIAVRKPVRTSPKAAIRLAEEP